MEAKTKVIVVPHTHWDREWYLTFEGFRFHLVQAMDQVLFLLDENPEYRFTLDGQVIPVLDYLEVRPAEGERIKKHVRSGRLVIGPWYIQPDEFLVSGEALIRNMLLGTRIAQRFGATTFAGYVPDAFGHIAQLPQILRGFGIDTAFVMRGADNACEQAQGTDFVWRAPDGSFVLCHAMETGYCNADRLSPDPNELTPRLAWLRRVGLIEPDGPPLQALLKKLHAQSRTGAVLLLNGCDHLAPQPNVLEVVEELNRKLPRYQFLVGTILEYVAALKEAEQKLPVVEGEFRTGKIHPILAGVLSIRMPLKQKNAEVQTLLERYAEPLAALVKIVGGKNLKPFLDLSWKILLQNHAHDSICGTGIDEVHKEMMIRFDRAETIARKIIVDALRTLGEGLPPALDRKGVPILVFNPCPWPRREEVVVEVERPLGLDKAEPTVMGPEGEITAAVLGTHLASEQVLAGVQHRLKNPVAFQADLPPLGFKLYTLFWDKKLAATSSLIASSCALENEFYRVEVASNGTLTLWDKESDHLFKGLCFFEDSGDAGDEYNYSPPAHQETITSIKAEAQVRVAEDLPWKGTLEVDFVVPLPAGLSPARKNRGAVRVDCPLKVFISLQRGLKRVDVVVELENNARDHRLRLGFPAGFKVTHAWAEDSFWVIRRPIRSACEGESVEVPPLTHPQKCFVAVGNEKVGMAILNRGLPEYEVTEDGTVFVTLLRSVGWLSRDDLRTRKGHAGPPYPTPDAQCLGRHRFVLAIYTYRGTWEEGGVVEKAHGFCSPMIGLGLRAPGKSRLPGEMSFVELEPAGLMLSAFKLAEDGDGIILRLYNPTRREIAGKIKVPWKLSKAELVRLDESAPQILPMISPYSVPVVLRSGEIKTVKLQIQPDDSFHGPAN